MWIEDLGPYDALAADGCLAVGWLERGRPYATGEVDRRVYDALVELSRDPWQPAIAMGHHPCDLCRFVGEAWGKANLFVPANGHIFACAELIVHYVNAHGYAPPPVFCGAVLACPPMRSMAYLRALLACGGGRLIRRGE